MEQLDKNISKCVEILKVTVTQFNTTDITEHYIQQ
jgi:hypothetical protein